MNRRKTRAALVATVWALCATSAFAQTDIEFIQWWEPEMPAGALRGIMDDFEKANPDIKVKIATGLTQQTIAMMRAQKDDVKIDVIMMDEVGARTTDRTGPKISSV